MKEKAHWQEPSLSVRSAPTSDTTASGSAAALSSCLINNMRDVRPAHMITCQLRCALCEAF